MNRFLFILLSTLILLGSGIVSGIYHVSSDVQQEWVRRYNGPGNAQDGATSIALDDSGNVYVTGYSWGGFGTGEDYATVKYNLSGVQQWVQRYGGPDLDRAFSIAVDDSANVYVTGEVSGDYTTLKYNTSGVLQWARTYGNPGADTDYAYVVKVDRRHNVYVTGTSVGSGTYRDYATVKYSPAGVQQWVARYNGPVGGVDEAYDLAVDDSGNVFVTGQSTGLPPQEMDIATVKYNSLGMQVWAQRYSGVSPGYSINSGNAITIDDAGNVYVTGYGWVIGYNGGQCITIKYSASGVQQWINGYSSAPEGRDIVVDNLQNVYITGSSWNGDNFDFVTIKYSSAGVKVWGVRYNGPANGDDVASALALDTSGNVYVTGSTRIGGTNSDYVTIKYTPAGVQEWIVTYGSPANYIDFARSIAVDKKGNVYVTGTSFDSLTGFDYATIKYSQLTGIIPASNEIPDEYRLYQNYPNPFNPTTKISFALPKSGFVKLTVYDIAGRKARQLVSEFKQRGIYNVEFNGEELSSGVYFYVFEADSYIESKKMLLLK